jgi:hypothetical protein
MKQWDSSGGTNICFVGISVPANADAQFKSFNRFQNGVILKRMTEK